MKNGILLYLFSRAQSPRRLFKYVKLLKADLARNTHLDRPKVHSPGRARKIQVECSWQDYQTEIMLQDAAGITNKATTDRNNSTARYTAHEFVN